MKNNHIDTWGLNEYFITELAGIESVGNGMLRLVNGVQRPRCLQPVYSVVMPAETWLRNSQKVEKIVREILRIDLLAH